MGWFILGYLLGHDDHKPDAVTVTAEVIDKAVYVPMTDNQGYLIAFLLVVVVALLVWLVIKSGDNTYTPPSGVHNIRHL